MWTCRKLGNEVRARLEDVADVRERRDSNATWPRSARSAAPCGSIRPRAAEAIARLVTENGG